MALQMIVGALRKVGSSNEVWSSSNVCKDSADVLLGLADYPVVVASAVVTVAD